MNAFKPVRSVALTLVGLTLVACGPVVIGAAVSGGGGGAGQPPVATLITSGPAEGSFVNTGTFSITYESPTATRYQWRLRPQDPWIESSETSVTTTEPDGAIAFEVRGAAGDGAFGLIARRNFGIDTVPPSAVDVDQSTRTGVGQVTVGWDAVADNNSGSGLQRYVVRFGSDQNNLDSTLGVNADTPVGLRVAAVLDGLQACATLTARVDVEDNAGNVATGAPFTFRTNCGGDGTFTELAPVSFGAGESVTAIGRGDFDGDGLNDLFAGLSTSVGGGRVSVLQSQGAAGFVVVPGGGVATPAPVRDLAVVDIDRDGVLDLLVAHGVTVDVFLANGDRSSGNPTGTFSLTDSRSFQSPVASLQVANFDNNGVPDLVVVEEVGAADRRITAIRGSQTGSLQNTLTTLPPEAFEAALVLDADGDSISDVVTTGSATVLRAGSALLQSQAQIGGAGVTLAAADVDLDGLSDLLVGEASPSAGARLLQNVGNGNFTDRGRGALPAAVQGLLVEDFDGDRLTDVLSLSASSFDLLPATDSGAALGLGTSSAVAAGDGVDGAAWDFDGDRITDFVVADAASDQVRVFRGGGVVRVGDGAFGPVENVEVNTARPFALSLTDLDYDRIPDIGATSQNPNLFMRYGNAGSRGQGDAVFSEDVQIATNTRTQAIKAGDLNRDGVMDVVVVEFNSGATVGGLRLLLGDGSGGYTSTTIGLPVQPRDCVIADVNVDGLPDVVVNHLRDGSASPVVPSRLTFLVNTGNASAPFSNPPNPELVFASESVLAMTSGDFDGDGDPDLAVADVNGGTYAIVENTDRTPAGFTVGAWQATSQQVAAADRRPTSFWTGDFNGDGAVDLVVANGNQARPNAAAINASFAVLPAVLDGSGRLTGTFGAPIEKLIAPSTAPSPWVVAAADLNGDLVLDLASVSLEPVSGQNQRVLVLLGQVSSPGRGNGMFDNPTSFGLSSTTPRFDVEIADMNGDGALDLVTAGGGQLEFLPGLGQ